MTRRFLELYNLINSFVESKKISLVGFYNPLQLYDEIMGVKCLSKEELDKADYDLVILLYDDSVSHSKFSYLLSDIYNLVMQDNIDEKKLVSWKMLRIPNVNIKRYLKLKNKVPTIFTHNCWAGMLYNYLGFEFKTPFINLWMIDWYFIEFLEHPKKYLKEELKFKDCGKDGYYGDYPICTLGDLELHFNHYASFEDAKNCWEKRKKRIDFDNLVVMMYTEFPELVERFKKLDYKTKICFSSVRCDDENIFYVDVDKIYELVGFDLWDFVLGNVKMEFPIFDVVELLLTGKIKKIAKMKE